MDGRYTNTLFDEYELESIHAARAVVIPQKVIRDEVLDRTLWEGDDLHPVLRDRHVRHYLLCEEVPGVSDGFDVSRYTKFLPSDWVRPRESEKVLGYAIIIGWDIDESRIVVCQVVLQNEGLFELQG